MNDKEKGGKLQIKGAVDRENVSNALLRNGYKVWIETITKYPYSDKYVLCYEKGGRDVE